MNSDLAYQKAYELYKENKYIEAFNELEYLADIKDNPNAQTLIANMYFAGKGTTRKPEKAYKYYKDAAKKGVVGAIFNLGIMFESGIGTEQSFYNALTCYKEISTKHPKVQEKIKTLYEQFKTKAAEGDVDSLINIGLLLNIGAGLKQNHESALNYYKKAAMKDSARAYHAIGVMYYHGEGVEQSYEKAMGYFNKASAKRHAKSLYAVGLMYMKGLGVTKNVEMALRYFKHASMQNYPEAHYALALSYINIKSYDNAVQSFTKAAELGYIPANYALGLINENRFNDVDKALTYYKVSADDGHINSQKALGNIYDIGRPSISQNNATAGMWYNKAANSGDEEAKEILTNMKFSKYTS